MTPPLRFCLIGQSVMQSPSAAMHNAALSASGIVGRYENRDVPPNALSGFVAELRAGRYRGCNVTIPYKAVMASMCDQLDGDAELLRAVNTVTVDSGRLIGDNTDVDGFELGLSAERMWPLPGSAAVVIGAGGAAAAVVLSLARVPVTRVTVAARQAEAAAELARRLAPVAAVDTVEWKRDPLLKRMRSAAIVVNATPAGLRDLPFHPRELPTSCTVADVRYRPRPIELVEAARATGHRACDGFEMLVHQGMLSLARWTGLPPQWGVARQAMLRALTA